MCAYFLSYIRLHVRTIVFFIYIYDPSDLGWPMRPTDYTMFWYSYYISASYPDATPYTSHPHCVLDSPVAGIDLDSVSSYRPMTFLFPLLSKYLYFVF